ncbi:MAG: hypothetical protein QF628_10200 [Acidimicrobiales bacterium]|jgi:hypothetical protein|nr:hypothetical protein [Acidimicrobiales bacterium]
MPIHDTGRLEMMPDMFDDHGSDDSSATGAGRSGKHCDACNEWLDSSDTHCPSCGSER